MLTALPGKHRWLIKVTISSSIWEEQNFQPWVFSFKKKINEKDPKLPAQFEVCAFELKL